MGFMILSEARFISISRQVARDVLSDVEQAALKACAGAHALSSLPALSHTQHRVGRCASWDSSIPVDGQYQPITYRPRRHQHHRIAIQEYPVEVHYVMDFTPTKDTDSHGPNTDVCSF